jgi:hypothetical protein
MKRIAMLLSAATVATAVAMFAPASPVSADTDVCAGTGTAQLSGGLVYPAIDPNARNVGFSFSFSAGACVAKPEGLFASGTVSGWCGLSSGRGATHQGHRFAWLGVGGELVLTGEVVGVVNAVPNALAGQSCTTNPGGASQFLVQGAALKVHCTVKPVKPAEHVANGFTVYAKPCV